MQSQLTIHAICIADSFRQDKLRKYFKEHEAFLHQARPDYHYVRCDGWGEAVVFVYGCIVFWGVDIQDIQAFLATMSQLSNDPCLNQVDEVYNIVHGEKTTIQDSNIILENEKIDTKIAISYALAQAVKLRRYEDIVMNTMPDLLTLPSDLAANGRISISKKNALKKTGEIFLVRAQINLHSDLLDTPEYFWERTEKEEHIYSMVAQEMELTKRVKKLNHRLDIMQSTYDLLRAHIEHKDSILLEVTITILIAMEIVITTMQYIWPVHIH